jgi:hypothetical protein
VRRIRHQHYVPPAVEPELFDGLPPTFQGQTFSEPDDQARLETALSKVKQALSTGYKWTLAELAAAAGCSEAGASARIRDCRRLFGWSIVAERAKGSLWRYYRVIP